MGNFSRGFYKYGICIRVKMSTCLSELRNTTHAIKQTCSYSLPGLASCRKANIGLGGLGGAVWIRKQCGCERALFRVLSPRRLKPCRRTTFRVQPIAAFTVQPGGTPHTVTEELVYVVLNRYMTNTQRFSKTNPTWFICMLWNLTCFCLLHNQDLIFQSKIKARLNISEIFMGFVFILIKWRNKIIVIAFDEENR